MKSPQKGFTIVELLVGALIFSVAVAAAANLLFSSLQVQRTSLATEQQLREESFMGEYMARALRQAKKELAAPPSNCLTTAGTGFNYELNASQDRIRFLNRNNLCEQFFLSSSKVYEQLSSDSTAQNFGALSALTSDNVSVQSLHFVLMGENQLDSLQPRATFFLQVNGIPFQTTVSQRNFDVQQ